MQAFGQVSFRAVLAVIESCFHQKDDGTDIQADRKDNLEHGSMGFVPTKIGPPWAKVLRM